MRLAVPGCREPFVAGVAVGSQLAGLCAGPGGPAELELDDDAGGHQSGQSRTSCRWFMLASRSRIIGRPAGQAAPMTPAASGSPYQLPLTLRCRRVFLDRGFLPL